MKRISLGKVLNLGHRVPLALRKYSWISHFKVARKQMVNQMSELNNKYGESTDQMVEPVAWRRKTRCINWQKI